MLELCAGVILAGGESNRMGSPKALLKLGRSTMLGYIACELKKVLSEVIVVGGDDYPAGLRAIRDIFPDSGPLGGIHAALVNLYKEYAFVVACDMPFVEACLVEYLCKQARGFDVVMPFVNGHPEPLSAVYGKGCLSVIENNLSAGKKKITGILPFVKVKFVGQSELSAVTDIKRVFTNVNTQEDLCRVKKLIKVRKNGN